MHTLTLRSLDSFDRRKPGRYTIDVVIRLDPFGFDGDDISTIVRAECRSQLFPTDGMRPGIGTFVAEAQHIQGSILLDDRRQTQCVFWPLVVFEAVEQPAVQYRVKSVPQSLQMQRVCRSKLSIEATVGSFLTGHRQCCLGYIYTQNRQPQRGDEERVFAGPAASIEYLSGEDASGC
jgi:hypothetical protein